MGPLSEDAVDLSIKFEQLVVDWLPEKLYLRRAQLAGGKSEEGNGFALWRRLHRDYKGQGQVIEYAGTQCLREYGRCKKLADTSQHIDGWYELFDEYGKELEHAHHMTRGMFLDIVPAELRTEILKEPKLNGAGHRELAAWCRNRVLVLTSEHLAEVRKKELTQRGRLNSLEPSGPSTEPPDFTDAPDWAKHLLALQTQAAAIPPVAAIQPPPRPSASARKSSPRRSSSPRVSLVPDWGNKCFHCGSDKHTREDCDKFKKMLSEAPCNKGKAKKDWKPPEGYKSAIGRARDAAKLALGQSTTRPKPKSKAAAKKKISALTQEEVDIDTASDSDFSDLGEIQALRPHRAAFASRAADKAQTSRVISNSICAVNKFSGLSEAQTYDVDMLESLNSWAHHVQVKSAPKKVTKRKPDPEVEQSTRFMLGKLPPSGQDIVVNSSKDADRVRPLPSSRKTLAKIVKRVSSSITLAEDERLCMVDSGAFTHAIDASRELPSHDVIPFGPNEHTPDGESACGSIIKCKGKVQTRGTVEGLSLDVQWSSMNVKVPILSVRKLVKDQHQVRFIENGGYIKNLRNGDRIPFFEFQGVYYLIMKILPPSSEPVFARPVP